MNRFVSVVLLGAGGTGSILAEPLARLVAHHPKGPRRFVVMDGDRYEEGNGTRQMGAFPGEGKASATVARLLGALGPVPGVTGLRLEAVDAYASRWTLPGALGAGPVIVVAAVDNGASRRMSLDVLDDRGEDYAWVSPGNGEGENAGQVYLHRVRDGAPETPDPRAYDARVGSPTDHIPGEGCIVAAASGKPQLLVANMHAAAWALAMVAAVLDDAPVPECVRWSGWRVRAEGAAVARVVG